eukprot:316521_1
MTTQFICEVGDVVELNSDPDSDNEELHIHDGTIVNIYPHSNTITIKLHNNQTYSYFLNEIKITVKSKKFNHQEENDNNSNIIFCGGTSTSHCDALLRLSHVFKYYEKYKKDIEYNDFNNVQHLLPHFNRHKFKIINDYHHILNNHLNENNQMDIFKHINQCQQQRISQCISAKRIKIILEKFNNINMKNITQHKLENIKQIINLLFRKNKYTNTQLLNDFNHIKYEHEADTDDTKFAELFQYFNIGIVCNPTDCQHIEIYYQERSNLQSQYILFTNDISMNDNDFVDEYTIKLVRRIHVYFLHSYDISRLSITEKEIIETCTQINVDDESKNEIDADKSMKMLGDVMKKKKHKLNIKGNYDKYIEITDQSILQGDNINFQSIHETLTHNKIFID